MNAQTAGMGGRGGQLRMTQNPMSAIVIGYLAGGLFAVWSTPPARQVIAKRIAVPCLGGLLTRGLAFAVLGAGLAAYLAMWAGRDDVLQGGFAVVGRGALGVVVGMSVGYVGLWAALGRRAELGDLAGFVQSRRPENKHPFWRRSTQRGFRR